MSLSDKDKAQLQSKRIKKLKYKATGLFLYHPASDSWIPAQCDDEGRLVIDPADLDTRYYTQTAADVLFEELLKLDGSRAMMDDLTLFQNPSLALHAVTKQYADALGAGGITIFGNAHRVNVSRTTMKYLGLNYFSWQSFENTEQSGIRAGTFKQLKITVFLNTLNANGIIVLRVNGVSSTLTLTIVAGTTGVFTANIDVSVSEDDLVNLMADFTSATSGSIYVCHSLSFEPS